jgi:hypothetical protein
MKILTAFLSGTILIALSGITAAGAEKLATAEMAAQKIEIRVLDAKKDVISGEVINKSPHPLRDIELLVQYHWLWANEFKPGDDPPGKAAFVKLDQELGPGESAAFKIPVDPPAAARGDGRYMTEVTLAGFTEIIPPATASR